MPKRKREDANNAANAPRPSQCTRNSNVQPGLIYAYPPFHCQPMSNITQFETCMLGHCGHCASCLPCKTQRQLTWQHDPLLREQLSSRSVILREQASVYDRIAPGFTRDHEAYDQIFMLKDQLHELLQQFHLIQRALPTNIQPEQPASDNEQQHVSANDEEDLHRVMKYESEVEERPMVPDFDATFPDGNVEAQANGDDNLDAHTHTNDYLEDQANANHNTEAQGDQEDDQFYTAKSTIDDAEDEIVLDREETPLNESADEFVDYWALIDQIPSSGNRQRYRPREAMVVIGLEEQAEARRSFEEIRLEELQRDEQLKERRSLEDPCMLVQREQPIREATLRTPRASVEGTPKTTAGSAWTAKEDRKLIKGYKKKLSSMEIHHKYLPNPSADAIRKRRQKVMQL